MGGGCSNQFLSTVKESPQTKLLRRQGPAPSRPQSALQGAEPPPPCPNLGSPPTPHMVGKMQVCPLVTSGGGSEHPKMSPTQEGYQKGTSRCPAGQSLVIHCWDTRVGALSSRVGVAKRFRWRPAASCPLPEGLLKLPLCFSSGGASFN